MLWREYRRKRVVVAIRASEGHGCINRGRAAASQVPSAAPRAPDARSRRVIPPVTCRAVRPERARFGRRPKKAKQKPATVQFLTLRSLYTAANARRRPAAPKVHFLAMENDQVCMRAARRRLAEKLSDLRHFSGYPR